MVFNKRKKNSRLRGTNSHGWGAKKKHRGSGHRGGKGMAGTGKRGDAKKPSIWKEKYFGKFGFKKKGTKIIYHTINLKDIEKSIDSLIEKKIAKKENDVCTLNLSDLNVNKLLGSGSLSIKLKITVDYASKGAIEKVQSAGGEITLNKQKSDG
ncbi:MAG: 50S ribosomal protein L15 [Nanoarchaeota archaeon]|nr:50S ribosomal protein L15 [Nanoarchaeota archaeon]